MPRLSLVLLAAALLAGCAATAPQTSSDTAQEHPSQERAPLPPAYTEATRDARIADPGEIDSTLIRIVPSNDRLVWERRVLDGDSTRVVKVVTWMGEGGFDDAVPGEPVSISRTTWVTAVPEVQALCRTFSGDPTAVTRRLEQLIGLPPNSGKTRFVELWARPDALRRPCPDPEVTDPACRRGDPAPSADRAFRTWFAELRASSYCNRCGTRTPYPWTRLGYTYDWNPSTDEVGVSEFVLFAPSTVIFAGTTPTTEYCDVEE
jgi:hypothetical protein